MAGVIQQASQQLNPAFAQAQQGVQGLIPDAEGIYQALIQGLTQQAGAQTQNVVQSADRRGVGRVGLAGDVGSQLGQEVALQTGMLGAQKAGDIAALRQEAGKLGVSKVNAITSLADTLAERSRNEQTAKLSRQETQNQYELDLQKSQREFETAKIAYARRQAEAAQAQQEKGLATSQALLAVETLWKPGSDGYVNPKQWNQLRRAFMEAGYSGGSFDSEFGYLVNPAHQARDSKLPRYKGASIKDEE